MKKLTLFILFIWILTACSPAALPAIITLTPAPTQPPLEPVSPLSTNTAIPEATLPELGTPAFPESPTPSPIPPTETATLTPTALPVVIPTYHIEVTINYDAHTLEARQDILYTNTSPDALDKLVLAVIPNSTNGVFTLKNLTLDGKNASVTSLLGQRLEIVLGNKPLEPGQKVIIGMEYSINLPPAEQGDPSLVRPAIFGYTSRQTNLTDWYPMIVPYISGEGWLLNKAWIYGEHLVYPDANFDVILRFANPDNAPIVAASGEPEKLENGTRYTLSSGRTFAFSMSREYRTASTEQDGITITSYYFPLNDVAGQAALDTTVRSVATYTQLFGEYHHKTLAVVQGDFNDGMEFDGLYFLSNPFYNLYDGTPQQYLVIVAAHETCHQWWFGRVANDQANEPWLDESLATYCEKLYYETNYPDLVPWWWSYRVDFYQPAGYIDSPVYDGGGFTPYTNATYRMGAHFLEDLRTTIGDDDFFAFLGDYATRMDGKIATTDDFFRILREHTDADISGVIANYFRNTP